MTLVLDENNFEETIKEGITLVDFWAEWCGPCQTMLLILDQFAEKMWEKIKVGKINVDESKELAQRFRVMSIPTLIVFKDWEPVEVLIWVQDMSTLEEVCGKYL